MSTVQNQVHRFDTYASGLRYGLLEINPKEEIRVKRKSGMKFIERTMKFEPSATSYEDFVAFNTQATIDNMSLPSNIKPEYLATRIANMRIESIEADTEFKKMLEFAENLRNTARGPKYLPKFIQFFLDRHRNAMNSIIEAYAAILLEDSRNLSLRIFADLTDFEVTYVAALQIILTLVRKFSALMSTGRAKSNSDIFKKRFAEMQYKLSPLIEEVEDVLIRAQTLKWYMMLSDNAEDLEESLQFTLDKEELNRLHWEFAEDAARLRKTIMKLDSRVFKPMVSESDLKSNFDEMVMSVIG